MSESTRMINELKFAGLFDEDSDYNGEIGEAVKELIEVFAKQDHSGFSAPHVANIFNRLVKGEVLSPLTGEKDEWMEVGASSKKGEGKTVLLQNKRCSHVFSEDGGKTGYDIDGKVFVEKNGTSYTSKDSKVKVTFPCVPKTEYVNV